MSRDPAATVPERQARIYGEKMSIDAQHRIGNLAKLRKEGRNVKKRTAILLVVVIGIGAFGGRRNREA